MSILSFKRNLPRCINTHHFYSMEKVVSPLATIAIRCACASCINFPLFSRPFSLRQSLDGGESHELPRLLSSTVLGLPALSERVSFLERALMLVLTGQAFPCLFIHPSYLSLLFFPASSCERFLLLPRPKKIVWIFVPRTEFTSQG